MKRVVILGGGFCGIYLAWRLKDLGFEPIVLEKTDNIGGLTKDDSANEIKYDVFYHFFMSKDRAIFKFLTRIGLKNELISSRFTQGLITEQLRPFNTARDFLKLPDFNVFEKIKLISLALILGLIPSPIREKLSFQKLARNILGTSLYKRSWKPLIDSKFKYENTHISAAHIWERLKRTNSKSAFALNNTIADFLRKLVAQKNIHIITNAEIKSIVPKRRTYEIRTTRENYSADYLISTIPIPELQKILEIPLNLSDFKYVAVACMVFLPRKEIPPHFFNTIINPNYKSCAIINMSALKGTIDGKFLNYISAYGPYEHFSDYNGLKVLFLRELNQLFPNFSSKDIVYAKVYVDPYAQPVWPPNFKKSVKNNLEPLPNLYIANQIMVYPIERSLNASLLLAEKIIKKIRKKERSYEN